MQVLINVAPDELPDKFRDLVDPDKPLKQPERFLPELRVGGFGAWLILIICTAIVGLMSESLVRQLLAINAGQGYELPNLILTIVTIPPLTWWGLRQWRLIRLGRMQAADMETGRYRNGVFFEPEAALSFDGQVGTLIPRDAVQRVVRRSSSREGGARAKGTYIIFTNPDNHEDERRVPGAGRYGAAAIWFEQGKPPAHRRGNRKRAGIKQRD